MEKQVPFAQRMEESQTEFRKQFDKNSQSYHKGIQVVVPMGGQRIPESMPTLYPQGYVPTQNTEVIDYGEEYKKVQKDRQILLNLKKSLAKLGPIIQSFMRHDLIFKQKGDPNNQKHIKTHQENVAKQKLNLKACQQQLLAYLPQLSLMDGEGKQMQKQLSVLIDQSNKKYDTKQTLGDFNFKTKKISAKTFSQAQKYLQRLKDIKKNYKKKQENVEQKKQQKVEQKAQ